MALWGIEPGDPLPVANHLVGGTFSFRKGEVYLGEKRAKELGLDGEAIGRELELELYFPGEPVRYDRVKLAGIVGGNSALADAAFLHIDSVRELLGIEPDQAPNYILSFADVRQAGAAAKRLKQAPASAGLAISAFSDDKVYRGLEDYLTVVDLRLLMMIFLGAAACQLFINTKQMAQAERSEIALRGLLGGSRSSIFGEYFGRQMALYGLGTLLFSGLYTPFIHHASTDGVSFLAHKLDPFSVDWKFFPEFSLFNILVRAGMIGSIAAGSSALAIGTSLRSRQERIGAETPFGNRCERDVDLLWHWSLLNLARNMGRNAVTFTVPVSAALFIGLETLYNGMEHDARDHLASTTYPALQISRGAARLNDAFNLVLETMPLAGVPATDGEAATGRVVFLADLTQSQSVHRHPVKVIGLDAQTDPAVFPTIVSQINQGGPIAAPGEIVLPQRTADLFGVGLGSEMTLTTKTEGRRPSALKFKVKGIYTSPNPELNFNSALISRADACALLGIPAGEVTEVDVRYHSFEQASRAAQRLRQEQPGFTYLDLLSRTRDIDDGKEAANALKTIFSLMMLLEGGYGAYSFAATSLSGRRQEIQKMQAAGLTLAQINKIISREVALAAACGGIAFTGLGLLASVYLQESGVSLAKFTNDQGLMGLPILDVVHGEINYGRALAAGALASLAPYFFIKRQIGRVVRPIKEPIKSPFEMTAGERAAFPFLVIKEKAGSLFLPTKPRIPHVISSDTPGDSPAAGETVISVRDLTLSFSDKHGRPNVLNINKLEVKKGEYVVIKGPSGSGKSSLLEVLSAQYAPTTGRITVENMGEEYRLDQLTDDAAQSEYRNGLAIIPQDLGLFEDLTVRENIYLGLADNARWKNYLLDEHIRAQGDRAMKELGIEALGKIKVSQLSGGQRQRVAIARALAKNPDILLIDEATASLDGPGKEEFLKLVKKLNQQGVTVIFVSHDEEMVLKQEGIRAVELVEGRIVV